MNDHLDFGLSIIVRAEIVRVIAEPWGDGHRFRQKPSDTYRFGRRYLGDFPGWPGVAVPADFCETPEGWPIEPEPNGTVLLRCRRMPFATPISGVLIGWTKRSEGSIAAIDGSNDLVHRRTMTLYEVALPPDSKGKARIRLVHPNDAHILSAMR